MRSTPETTWNFDEKPMRNSDFSETVQKQDFRILRKYEKNDVKGDVPSRPRWIQNESFGALGMIFHLLGDPVIGLSFYEVR